MDFRQKVLKIVRGIPRGQVMSYGAVAKVAGNPKAARAVGAILKTNYDLKIPCHRVILSNGKLGGYNRGLKSKKKLLKQEGAIK